MNKETDALIVTFRVDDCEGGWALFQIEVCYKVIRDSKDGGIFVDNAGAEIKKLRDDSYGIYARVCECY